MELLILSGALLLSGLLAVVKGFQYTPNNLSDFELGRRAGDGDGAAEYELYRRPLLQTFLGLRVLKVVIITSMLAVLLLATHNIWLGLLLLVGFWLVSELAVAKGWLASVSVAAQRATEPKIIRGVHKTSGVLKHLAPRQIHSGQGAVVGSRDELAQIIATDQHLLTPDEKLRLQAAMALDGIKVKDVMVPRDKIATVDEKETVGPVLLDRLHKDGHNIFVAVKKDLDHIKGLLYMSDAASGHPDIKTVKDALRPIVHYISQKASLTEVMAASLQSGRQLFIVVDDNGNAQGLITLRDALAKLLGSAPPDDTHISTDPKKVRP